MYIVTVTEINSNFYGAVIDGDIEAPAYKLQGRTRPISELLAVTPSDAIAARVAAHLRAQMHTTHLGALAPSADILVVRLVEDFLLNQGKRIELAFNIKHVSALKGIKQTDVPWHRDAIHFLVKHGRCFA